MRRRVSAFVGAVLLLAAAAPVRGQTSDCARVVDRGGGWTTVSIPAFPAPRFNSINGQPYTGYTYEWAVSPEDRGLMIASDESSIILTRDGGCTWEPVYKSFLDDPTKPQVGSLSIAAAHPDKPPGLYAVGWDRFAGVVTVVGSHDLGKTWSRLAEFPGYAAYGNRNLMWSPVDPDLGFLSIQASAGFVPLDHYLFRTTDGGKTWTEISSPVTRLRSASIPPPQNVPSDHLGFRVAFDPLDEKSVWVWGGQSLNYSETDLFHSTDGGATFAPVPMQQWSGKPLNVDDAFVTHEAGAPARVFVTSSEEADPPTSRQVFESADGGATWTSFSGPAMNPDVFTEDIQVAPGLKPGRVLWTSMREVFRLDPRTKRWIAVTPDYRLPNLGPMLWGVSTSGGVRSYYFTSTGENRIDVYSGKV